ncbi:hypothetical protein NHX12_027188 [Muraenolepis orangiensis]|uniref:Uncharacterized protein n=1 Tax=Muraenolepis orangiensis TaxID=630683 RepID=A0A9Q0EEZ6_9TELE|nr:hypothetical protein NHX12_027188 [Muraenolepis orangiensis]
MSSSMSVRSFSLGRHPSFSSLSLRDSGRPRASRASVSFAASVPLSRSASASQDLNGGGPAVFLLNGFRSNSANDKEAMQGLNGRLANYLDKVRLRSDWSHGSAVRTLERSNADLEMKIKQLMIERIPKGHDMDAMMSQAHAVELEVRWGGGGEEVCVDK